MPTEPSDAFVRAAVRAQSQPWFLAGALAQYQRAQALDDAALAAALGCASADLPRLALCRRPDPADPVAFAQDVVHLAQRFGLAADLLATICQVGLPPER